MDYLIGRELAQMMLDSAPVAAGMEGNHCTPSFFLIHWFGVAL